jgi:hypothetical protein
MTMFTEQRPSSFPLGIGDPNPAELHISASRAPLDAIRFAIEELPPELLLGAYLEVEEERFDGNAIRRLYESLDYPLPRSAAKLARKVNR